MRLFGIYRSGVVLAAVIAFAGASQTVLSPWASAQDRAQPSPATEQPQAERGDQQRQRRGQRRIRESDGRDGATPERSRAARLPAPSVTRHRIEVAGRTLQFTATAEAIAMVAEDGKVTGEIAVVSYTLDGADPAKRPVTFAMNGGPGSASAWVHIGLMGPWRLALDGAAARPSAPPLLEANAETWLDFTDLVFIDPVGTGFSRLVGDEEARKKSEKFYYSVGGDVESVAATIRIWLTRHRRLLAPKFFAGESYAGFRGPKVARTLQTAHGIGLDAIMLISPVIDFGLGRRGRREALSWAIALPSQAAAAADRKGPLTRSQLAPFEAYARGPFLADLMRGERDAEAVARIVARVAELTGLDAALVSRLKGRIDRATFMRELDRERGLVGSAYDATVGGIDPYPASARPAVPHDPFTTALAAPVTSAMLDLYAGRLAWLPERRYRLSGNLLGKWDWGNGRTANEATGDLEAALALDPKFVAHISHGYADLVTPYFASQLIIDQIAAAASAARVTLSVYPGGHMFYSRNASRSAYRAEIEALITGRAGAERDRGKRAD